MEVSLEDIFNHQPFLLLVTIIYNKKGLSNLNRLTIIIFFIIKYHINNSLCDLFWLKHLILIFSIVLLVIVLLHFCVYFTRTDSHTFYVNVYCLVPFFLRSIN